MSQLTPLNREGGAVFLDAASIDCGDVDFTVLSKVAAPLHVYPQTAPKQLADCHPNAWCVITNKVVLDRRFFQARPNLRLVCITATGINNVDMQAAKEYGVEVMNCRGYSTETVAQHTCMLILALVRSLYQYQLDVTAGRWSNSAMFCLLDHPVRELKGLKLGIVGYGDIGQRVADIARFFDMDVLIANRPNGPPKPDRMPFRDVLASCDILTLHCPLTPDTEHLINTETLNLLRPGAFLINTSRGQLVDELALLHALGNQKLAGAALDVLVTEPPSMDNPLLQAQLENLIITPHCAWASREARQAALEQTAKNIERYLNGS